jgi:KDO2-lipid IV(A) lauroyltransferase
LGEARSRRLAQSIGRVLYRVLGTDRAWCLRNLALVFGDQLTPSGRVHLAMRVFEHFSLSCVEAIRWTPEWMWAKVLSDPGTADFFRDAARRGKTFIFVSPHLGNFELISSCWHLIGLKGTVMYRPLNNWRVERLLSGARSRYGDGHVPRTPFALMSLMYSLREGKSVGLLIDVNTLDDPVFVDFLGFQAASPPGAAALSLATGVPVVLSVCLRHPDGTHRLTFSAPFEPIRTGDRRRDIVVNMQRYTRAIEPYVLQHPEQYNWLHPRWRLRPDGHMWTLHTSREQMESERVSTPRERMAA